ncbi:MAG: hypothetical protein ACE5R5_08110 [Nitrosarchaeum sp.]
MRETISIESIEKPDSPISNTKQIAGFNFDDGSNLSKNIFYACMNCNGPLVPISMCVFCKRASLRKCIKCGKPKEIQSHESCKILITFGNTIAQKHSEEVKI